MERGDSIHSDGHENDTLDPLLAKEDTVVFGDEEDEWKCSKDLVWEEVKKQCWIAGPMMAVNLLQFGLRMISVMLVGHLGELALSSASIATSFANFSGISVLMGMGIALDTLCAKKYHQLMIFGSFLCEPSSLPSAVVWAYTVNNVVAFWQDLLYLLKQGNMPD